MKNQNFQREIEKITEKDPRYSVEAYEFVSDAVVYTARLLERTSLKNRHISGKELLDGIRKYAIDQFGPLAGEVLKGWGIHDGRSVGDIVFNMVNNQLLGKTENDSIEDFNDGFDFEEAFGKPFAGEGRRRKVQPPPIID